jgi:hypothetical protein
MRPSFQSCHPALRLRPVPHRGLVRQPAGRDHKLDARDVGPLSCGVPWRDLDGKGVRRLCAGGADPAETVHRMRTGRLSRAMLAETDTGRACSVLAHQSKHVD